MPLMVGSRAVAALKVGAIDVPAAYRGEEEVQGVSGWFAGFLDLDFENGRYYLDGETFDDLAALLTAAGGSEASGVITFLPKDKGDNYLTNPTMDGTYAAPAATGNPDGWAPGASYVGNISLSFGGGQMSQQSPGTGQARWRMPFTAVRGKAYRASIAQTDFGTKSGNVQASSNGDIGGSQNAVTFVNGVTPSVVNLFFAGIANGTMYWGVAISGTTALRTYDDAELYEVEPLVGWNELGRAVVIDFVTPTTGGSKRVLWQSDATNEQNRQRIEWDASNNLRFITNYNNVEQTNINLGTVAPATAGRVHASMSDNLMFARLDDGPTQGDTTASVAGATHMRIGNSFTGEAWGDGQVTRLTYYNHEFLPSDVLFMSGDSYMGTGAGGVCLPITARAAGKPVRANAISSGGWTLAQIAAEVLANARAFTDAVLVIWDGNGVNGFVDLPTTMALYASMVAAKPDGKFLIIPSLKRGNHSAQEQADTASIQSALAAAYPGHIVNAQAILAARATSPGDDADVAAGVVPTSLLQGDASHLTSAAMGYVWGDAGGVGATLTALGW